jgi:parallel beta-helix repeat protein
MKNSGLAVLCGLVVGTFAYQSSSYSQGPLTPPGPPAPTMKTLDQVEARLIVNATNAPGDSANQFIISAPGSYYLTGNITGVSGKNGITINADDVTLDLNGFALIGVGGSLRGIFVPTTHRNLRIHNGTVHNWGSNSGMNCSSATNCQFDHLRISQSGGFLCGVGSVLSDVSVDGNSGGGLATGDRCTLKACSATGNTSGFSLGSYCTITESTAAGNSNDGMSVGSFCTILGCTVTGSSIDGIGAGSDCTIKDCTVSSNAVDGIHNYPSTRCLVVNCTASGNGSIGIWCGANSTVKLCNASKNGLRGIEVEGGSLVLENQCYNNVGDGITCNGSINRVDGNHTNYNGGYGINAGADWVIRNTSSNNTSGNFNPAGGGDIGPIQTASTATNPFANLQ